MPLYSSDGNRLVYKILFNAYGEVEVVQPHLNGSDYDAGDLHEI